MTVLYRIETAPDDNGTLIVTCPAFPEVTTFAPNARKQLRSIARAALEEAVAARITEGRSLPRPARKAARSRGKGLYVTISLRGS